MSGFIEIRDLSKSFGEQKVVDGLNLEMAKGEFLSLLGPSGSGKTTILMMLAGFESPTSGQILVGGREIAHLPPHHRGIGVVFQNYALFPHMTVAQNVAFPLEMRRLPKAEIQAKVKTALERVRLSHLAERRPTQLSGGQQQRVALTRALVFEPEVILMDEPLGALDKQLREEMQLEIRELHRRLGLTIVFVTHDQAEALTMSDRIAVFDRGRISQIGPGAEIYDHPQNRFVAQFIGETNLLEVSAVAPAANGDLLLTMPGGGVIRAKAPPHPVRAPAVVSIRPERVKLEDLGAAPPDESLEAVVEDVVYQGDHLRLHLAAGPLKLVARAERGATPRAPGDRARLSIRPADCSVFAS